jgi:predicted SAM-dependent methyltransferase
MSFGSARHEGQKFMDGLNLGCGARFHTAWTNIDFHGNPPYVQAYDLRRGVPAADASFDVVYHSHVLEHFGRDEALPFLRECFRVLRPDGVIRVAVPDLEQIARQYCEALDRALEGDPVWQARYDWLMLELYDQTVRVRSGGAMQAYLEQPDVPEVAFIVERVGAEARGIMQRAQSPAPTGPTAHISLAQRWRHWRKVIRSKAQIMLLGWEEYRALQLGRFRMGGEIHQWMYDRYSLARLLESAGFEQPTRRTAHTSAIPGWTGFNLDTAPDGSVYKPDSLFMEAVKPGDARSRGVFS